MDNDSPHWIFEKISESSQAAQNAYIIYLSSVTYSALTIATISDLQIIINDKVKLPILGIELPITGFFLVTPLILLIFYIYFQVYHFHLIKLLSRLSELNQTDVQIKYYPWLVNILFNNPQGFSSLLYRIIFKASIWWSLPLTLFIFPLTYIKKHDIFISSLLGAIPAFGTCIVLYFWINQEKLLNKKRPKRIKILKQYELNRSLSFIIREYGKILLTLLSIFLIGVFYTDALKTIKKKLPGNVLINRFIFANLQNINLGDNNTRYNLDHVDLYGATLNYVSLKNANIRWASFKYAKISNCNFENTDFSETDFNNSYLYYNSFKKAIFNGASFESTHSNIFFDRGDSLFTYRGINWENDINDFSKAEFTNTSIKKALFSKVNFSECLFRGVNIDKSNFEYCNFHKSIFTDYNGIPKTKKLNITNTVFRECDMDSLEVNTMNGAFKRDTLQYSRIRYTNFIATDMTGSVFLGNILSGTYFNMNNMSGVRFWDENNPDYEYFMKENKHSIIYGVIYISNHPLKNNLKQITDVKQFNECKMDSTLFNTLNKYYPSLIKPHNPFSIKYESVWAQ